MPNNMWYTLPLQIWGYKTNSFQQLHNFVILATLKAIFRTKCNIHMPDFADGDQQTELDKTLPLDPLSRLNCLVFGVH